MTDSDENSHQLRDLSTLIEHRRALGDTGALRISDQRFSYTQIAALVEQRAAALTRAGIAARELVLCPTTPVLDSLVMQWALARLGVAMLPTRPDLPCSRRDSLLRATGAEWYWEPANEDTGLVSRPSAEIQVKPRAKRKGSADRQPIGTLIPRRPSHASAPAPAPRQQTGVVPDPGTTPAVLVETSGSSTEPKIVMLSAANVVASCLAVNARLDLGLGDRWLCVLPRHHVSGLAIGYRCALAGAELMVQSRFDAEAVRTALREERVTHLSLVPAMLERLLGVDARPPPWLRVALLGGQGLDAGLARRARERGWPLYLGYGMTETFSQIAGGWIGDDGSAKPGLVPLDDVELNCPSCGNGRGQPLRLRAPMLMLGYGNPRRTPGDGLDNGWLETSDLACRLPDGSLQVLGRADDVVLIAGVNVLPAEIERALAQLEQIAEIAVIGVPDRTWGHRLVALYTGELEPAEADAWCRSNLPSQHRPRTFARVETLPTLGSGKRDRQALIAQAEALAKGQCQAAPDRLDAEGETGRG